MNNKTQLVSSFKNKTINNKANRNLPDSSASELETGYLDLNSFEIDQYQKIINSFGKKRANQLIERIDLNWYYKKQPTTAGINLPDAIIKVLDRNKINDILWDVEYIKSLYGVAYIVPLIVNGQINLYVLAPSNVYNITYENNQIIEFSCSINIEYGNTFSLIQIRVTGKQVYQVIAPKPVEGVEGYSAENIDSYLSDIVNDSTLEKYEASTLPIIEIKENPLRESMLKDIDYLLKFKSHLIKKMVDNVDLSSNSLFVFDKTGGVASDSVVSQKFKEARNSFKKVTSDGYYTFSRAQIDEMTNAGSTSNIQTLSDSISYVDKQLANATNTFLQQSSKSKANQQTTEIVMENFGTFSYLNSTIKKYNKFMLMTIQIVSNLTNTPVELNTINLYYQNILTQIVGGLSGSK